LEKALLKQIVQAYERATRDLGVQAFGQAAEDDIIAKLEKRIIDLAKYVITTKDNEKKITGKLNKSVVTVTDYKYDLETRQAAARMLTDRAGSFAGWSKEAKSSLHSALKSDVEGMLNSANLKSFSDSMLSRPLRDWYLKQQTILKYLPPARRPTSAPPATVKK